MAFTTPQSAHRNVDLIPAILSLAVASLVSAVHIDLFGTTWSLLWLPFLIVALWPRRAHPLVTAVILFLAGLWLDWATLGAPGQWALVFLITFAILRPDLEARPRGVLAAYRRFGAALLLGVPVFIVTGWLVYRAWPDWISLVKGVSLAALILPVISFLRDRIALQMGEVQ